MGRRRPTEPPDYGIDAPGIRRAMLAVGAAGATVGVVAPVLVVNAAGLSATVAAAAAACGALATAYGFSMAAFMTWSSRVGKRRTRERLLDRIGDLAPWTGRNAVLDVGCGRGLMLVGAARRLASGTAVGVDVWPAQDQSGNGAEAALANARREGVAGRVRVETGDVRALPFAYASLDAVLSHWVVHNIPDAAGRARALDEMLRVLRSGGALALADMTMLPNIGRISLRWA